MESRGFALITPLLRIHLEMGDIQQRKVTSQTVLLSASTRDFGLNIKLDGGEKESSVLQAMGD